MKQVAAFSTPTEAHLVVARLQDAGIEARPRDEFTVDCLACKKSYQIPAKREQ